MAAVALSVATPAAAAEPPEDRAGVRRASYVPDQLKLQLAGNVGFVSPGVGYAFLRRRLETDLFFGWVPESIGGTDILSVTAKLTGQPFRMDVRGVELRPVTIALQLTYTFGDEYFVRPPSQFPGGYYDFPTAIRAGLAVGSAATMRVGNRRIGAYYELVALDVMLRAWSDNRRTMGPLDVFSLALGVRAEI
jgi:hypothetical protein